MFNAAWENGISILPGLTRSGPGFPTAAEYAAWDAAVDNTVKIYGPGGSFWSTRQKNPTPVAAWSVWNEPNLAFNNPPRAKTECTNPSFPFNSSAKTCVQPGNYANFLATTATTIRAALPTQSQVLFAGLYMGSEVGNYGTFLEQAGGNLSTYDGVLIHPYSFFGGVAELAAKVKSIRGTLNKVGGAAKPLWIGELGWPVANPNQANEAQEFKEGKRSVGAIPPMSEAEQASLLTGSFNWIKSEAGTQNIAAAFWYNLRDNPGTTWASFCGLRREDGSYRPAWYAFQDETGASHWPGGTFAFQGGSSQLFTGNLIGNENTLQGMASGTSPSITTLVTGGSESAFQANSGELVTFGQAGNTNWHQGMAAGTSPAIAMLTGGGYQTAFQANTTALVTIGTAGGISWGLGMATGTSPSIAGLSTGGYEAAFQANNSQLTTVGTAGSTNWGLGMATGTSPSIAGFASGGFEVAMQANNSQIWTVGTAGNTNWGLGMAAGTSPSITTLPGGGYEAAFQTNGGTLWTIGTAGSVNWGQPIAAGTSPSISALPGGSYEVVLQAPSGELITTGPGLTPTNTHLGIAKGTSPSITSG
jgi:hypothetical protein